MLRFQNYKVSIAGTIAAEAKNLKMYDNFILTKKRELCSLSLANARLFNIEIFSGNTAMKSAHILCS